MFMGKFQNKLELIRRKKWQGPGTMKNEPNNHD
jgi:hypothetical protein